ncbi:MAG: hypothetical protein V4549_09970 [Bacteroidota bacterium]
MIFEPRIFYQTYQKDYHKIKATYLKGMLEDLPKYGKAFFGKDFDKEYTSTFRRTLKSDLRQTYFHAIETFFELFFALNPKDKDPEDAEFLLFTLTYANWQETFKKIKNITENENALDFLDEKMVYLGYNVTIGQYLFYTGLFSTEKFPKEFFDEVAESIEAIKYGIKTIAKDFVNREEYNAYKHGLRIIPASSKIMFTEVKTMEVKVEFDLTESMSFYMKTKYPDELKVITKLFDVERDFQMTYFCSNLIHHLIFYRRIAMKFEKDKEKFSKIPISMFGKEPIEKCNKINVEVQDLEYTITRTEKEIKR